MLHFHGKIFHVFTIYHVLPDDKRLSCNSAHNACWFYCMKHLNYQSENMIIVISRIFSSTYHLFRALRGNLKNLFVCWKKTMSNGMPHCHSWNTNGENLWFFLPIKPIIFRIRFYGQPWSPFARIMMFHSPNLRNALTAECDEIHDRQLRISEFVAV